MRNTWFCPFSLGSFKNILNLPSSLQITSFLYVIGAQLHPAHKNTSPYTETPPDASHIGFLSYSHMLHAHLTFPISI